MKILHINTFLTGGAAVAALKLHRDISNAGIESKLLCLHGNIDESAGIYKAEKKSPAKAIHYAWCQLQYKLIMATPIRKPNHEAFSFPYSMYDLAAEQLVQEADVINLHWVSKFLDVPSFFKTIKKPIVWTLHDMNPFSGGFHYEDDELFNTSAKLGRISKQIRRVKENIYAQTDNLNIVTPSKWMMNESSNSRMFSRYPHTHIPLSVDPGLFTMTDKQKSREELNLPQDKIIFTFLSDRLDNKRKGLEILLQSINTLPEEDKSKVLIVNIGQGDYNLPSVVNVGRISDQRKIATILSAADALMLPSREDNFPNVMLEANACGCPVIAFSVGGVGEFIKEGFNGLMAKEVSAKSFRELLQTFVREKPLFDRAKIREHVVANYSPARQAESYISLYKKLLAK